MPVDLMDLGYGQDAGAAGGDAAPGAANDRAVDINSYDPLVNLGLVDPRSGAALPTDDWQPPAPAQTQTPAQTGQAPAQVPGQASTPASASAPGAGVGVGAGAIDPLAGQELQATVATLQAQAAAALAQAVQQGADPGQAQTVIGARLQAEIAKAQAIAVRQASAPAVKAQVAQIVAGKLGNGLVAPEDLMGYDSPQAMEQAASQLAAARRNQSYQARRQAGVDRAEGASSPAGLNPAIAGLSPEKKIELGIRRGQG